MTKIISAINESVREPTIFVPKLCEKHQPVIIAHLFDWSADVDVERLDTVLKCKLGEYYQICICSPVSGHSNCKKRHRSVCNIVLYSIEDDKPSPEDISNDVAKLATVITGHFGVCALTIRSNGQATIYEKTGFDQESVRSLFVD
jgi:hypothetical protein